MPDQTPTIVAPVARSVYAANLLRTTAFYRDALGFQIEHDQAVFGPATLQFTNKESAASPSCSSPASAEFSIANADALYTELRAKGDLEGNRLTFAQTFE